MIWRSLIDRFRRAEDNSLGLFLEAVSAEPGRLSHKGTPEPVVVTTDDVVITDWPGNTLCAVAHQDCRCCCSVCLPL